MNETKEIQSFPLSWPYGWERTNFRQKAQYKVTFSAASKDVARNLKLLGAQDVICSSNLRVKPDGMPYAEERLMEDPGIAVFFTRKGVSQVMACDKWLQVKDNLRAVGLALEAMRQLERCGASEILNRAFMGFTALPPPQTYRDWRDVLKYGDGPMMRTSIDSAYKTARSAAHPDKGGTPEAFNEVEEAYKRALTELEGVR